MPDLRVGIDSGGTFTDVVAIDGDTGRIVATKVPSTPDDPSIALASALDKVLGLCGADRSALDSLIHGTTVATNALLEERFDSLALVTTEGFRHILKIARQSVPSGYGNSYFSGQAGPHRAAASGLRGCGAANFRGDVLRPLDEESVRAVGKRLKVLNVRATAVSLIHAYANPAHEARVREILLEEHPGMAISLSAEVLPEYREYERTMTTCIDAHIKAYRTIIESAVSRVGVDGAARS